MVLMKKHPTPQQAARQRAEMIMKVRCGLMTASQAAEQLGVSRKTYYKWEQRGLSALLDGLSDQSPGRPTQPVDTRSQKLEKQLDQMRRDNELLKQQMALKDLLTDLKLEPGMSRVKKK
jgi:transposase-like protein